MANTNYITADVKNGYGKSFLATGKFPIVAKRAWKTYADALEYAGDINDSCFAGAILAVINDTNPKNNGVYLVESCPTAKNPAIPVVLTKVGAGEGSMALAKFTLEGAGEVKTVKEATEDNIGQIIYITEGNANDESVTDKNKYPAGPYIVTGVGTVAKLGTTTASGDLAGDVNTLKGQVNTLQSNVQTLTTDLDSLEDVVGNETEGLVYNVNQLVGLTSSLKVKDVQDDGTSLVGKNGIVDLKDYAKSTELTTTYDELLGKINSIEIPEVPVYAISKTDELTYVLTKDGQAIEGSTINIPKDMVVNGGTVRELADDEITETRPAGLYIVLELNDESKTKLYIPADKLVDNYTGSTYVTVNEGSRTIELNTEALKSANIFDVFGSASAVQSALDTYIGSNNKALNDYLKTADLDTATAELGYAKKDEVAGTIAENNKSYTKTTELDNYIKSLGYFKADDVNSAINTKLTSYSTTEQVNSAISTAIGTALEDYFTSTEVNDAIDTKLTSYSTTEEVNDAIDTKLAPYATTESVNTALGSYVKKDDLDAISTDEIDAIIDGTKTEE